MKNIFPIVLRLDGSRGEESPTPVRPALKLSPLKSAVERSVQHQFLLRHSVPTAKGKRGRGAGGKTIALHSNAIVCGLTSTLNHRPPSFLVLSFFFFFFFKKKRKENVISKRRAVCL
jgi:hypothetical protein